MIRALPYLAGLITVVALVVWVLSTRVSSTRGALPAGDDPATFRLAQRMARILDRQLHDDLVRPVLPSEMRAEMEAVIADFYGDPPSLDR